MIKLVALDLDGTLVNERLEISAATVETLKRAQEEKGVKVVIATGRMFPSSLPFARTLGIVNPVISYQGAMIRDIADVLENVLHHPVLFHQTIETDVAKSLIDFIQDNKLHANLYVDDALFTTQYNPNSAFYKRISGVMPQEVADLHHALTAPPSKLMIIDDNSDEILATLQRDFPATLSVCKSRSNFVEVVHHAVSKWTAIEHLMQQWDIQPEEVMAIGDQGNDLSMIHGAGVGVAMGNAPDEIKAVANYVTDTVDQDGAAKAIEKFVFGHLPLTDPDAEGAHANRAGV